MTQPLVRRLLGVPRPAHRHRVEEEWIALSDGVRLATRLWLPADRSTPRAPAVLVRTPFGSRGGLEPTRLLAEALAGAGLAVVVQDVRGRFGSEGTLLPFEPEARDGEDAIRWIEAQPWYAGRLGLAGFSYAGFAALAAAAGAPDRVAALATAGAAHDVCRALRPGGAFALELGLRLAVALEGQRSEPPRDLDRALAHRPLREADRIALRELPWFRAWIDRPPSHPDWRRLGPEVPKQIPTLALGGGFDPWLPAIVADHAARAVGGESASTLVLGPWPHPRPLRFARADRAFLRVALREMVGFLAAALAGDPHGAGPCVRVLDGARELALDGFPPATATRRVLHLRSRGFANRASGDGRLSEEGPSTGEPPDRFAYDPDDPAPSVGGALLLGGGPADQRGVEERADVLCYTGDPLAAPLDVVGPVRVVLHAASSAPDTDFTAKLVDVEPGGRAGFVCEGIVRARWRAGGAEPVWLAPDAPDELCIDLGPAFHRFRAGHRLRLDVSSSSFPRFDRNPNTRGEPGRADAETSEVARQTLLHEATHPSRLELFVLEPGSENDTGPPNDVRRIP
ncbi:MAG TPA: CocE/NonD family hydrolase [Myxococcota bacterium]|nr:CocE/NonD family hydrolase [Myxococcota bacterium]